EAKATSRTANQHSLCSISTSFSPLVFRQRRIVLLFKSRHRAEMRRCSRISSLLAALALLLLLCFFHGAAAARPLPVAVPLVHQENGSKVAADGDPVLQKDAAGNGDELSVSVAAEEMGAAEVEEPACEEGNDECMQRRLLHDAHLDYIYTQHKGKP
ncbi:unnamed protein product, partial [Urochloa humidicola]